MRGMHITKAVSFLKFQADEAAWWPRAGKAYGTKERHFLFSAYSALPTLRSITKGGRESAKFSPAHERAMLLTPASIYTIS